HGINHPSKFGEATHIGFALDIPSIGVAKNPFYGISDYKKINRKKGEKTPIKKNKQTLGYAIVVTDNCKPVFTSVGYNVNLSTALKVVLRSSIDHRQPEPLFLADHYSRAKLKIKKV
ncbi:MAG: endonuclease V, partial [Candidatus Lokiarchaeota archaeon]|nr:endonuclease V [Candidatus Lokiarchaeota archaeon]